ncbi:MAG: hypothetical protein ABFQ62_00345 [Patescibacteria group bacterium]
MKQIISSKNIIRSLIVIVIILSFVAAYYKNLFELELKRYKRLEDRYVRVRSSLGVEKTQELIDISRRNDNL